MQSDASGAPFGTGSREPSPAVSALPGFDPSRMEWRPTRGEAPDVGRSAVVYALGYFGDVYGPLPFEMFAPDAWEGGMLGRAHDLIAFAYATAEFRNAFAWIDPASAIEARRAETHSGSVHESAVGNAETPVPEGHHSEPQKETGASNA